MDKFLKESLNRSYPTESTKYRLGKAKIRTIMEDVYDYSYFASLDDVINLLKNNRDISIDEFIGELHFHIQDKLNSIKGVNYYKCRSMANLEWLINFTENSIKN